MKIQIKKLVDNAAIPTKGTTYSAGYDLYSIEEYTLKPLERKLFKTGISMSIPIGTYGRIAPRSGLAYKHGIDVLAGVIDSDYRGDIGVILINLGSDPVKLPFIKDDKQVPIAQIIFENHNEVSFETTETLGDTVRGEGGFGHTNEDSGESTVAGSLKALKTIVNGISPEEYSRMRGIIQIPEKPVEPKDISAPKYNETIPYHKQTTSSNILEKWKSNNQKTSVSYETLIKERERQ